MSLSLFKYSKYIISTTAFKPLCVFKTFIYTIDINIILSHSTSGIKVLHLMKPKLLIEKDIHHKISLPPFKAKMSV